MEQISPKMTIADISKFFGVSTQAIHKKIKEGELVAHKNGKRLYIDHNQARKFFNFELSPKCITMHNLKGGVGKTNISFNLACRLSLYGAKVALIDTDQQGNLTIACNIDAERHPILMDIISGGTNKTISECLVNVCQGVDILPSRTENATLDMYLTLRNKPLNIVLREDVKELKKIYDFIIIDTPPSLSATVTAAYLAADMIIMPTDPEKFSLNGIRISLQELYNIAKDFKLSPPPEAKILLNKFDSRTIISNDSLAILLSDSKYSPQMLSTFIRISQDFPNSVMRKQSIYDDLKFSTAKEDIDALAKTILETAIVNSKTKTVSKAEEHAN